MNPDAAASEGKMEESERRFRALFEHSFQFMWLLSPAGVLLEVNASALAFGGLSRQDVVGLPFWETGWWPTEGESRARLRSAIAEAARGSFVRYEAEAVAAGGREAVIDFSVKPIFEEDGSIPVLVAEGRDVTEARWAERALRVSEAKFAGIVNIASDAIISIDESQAITLFNIGAEQIFGWTAEEVLGRPLEILIPERYRAAHGDHVRLFGRSGVAARRMGERTEISGLRRSGEEFPAEASISRMLVGGERIYTVLLRDVTARRRAEQTQQFLAGATAALVRSLDFETTLRSIARLAVPAVADWCAIYLLEPRGVVRTLEVAHGDPERQELAASLTRDPLGAPGGHPVFDVLASGESLLIPEAGTTLLNRLAATPEQRALYERLGINSLLCAPLLARGRTLGAIAFFSGGRAFGAEDVSLLSDLATRSALAIDNARLYREAREAVHTRDEVLSIVSHDLGNPLSAIRIGTTLLLRGRAVDPDHDSWQHLDAIRQSVEQMERLINDLLEVKRLDAGRLELHVRPQSPESLIREAHDMLRGLAQEKDQRFDWEAAAELPEVAADRQRVLQLFSNLIGNAIKFTPRGGHIRVSAAAGERDVVFTVADTGPGIEAASLPHIFDRFWRARRTAGSQGFGLGLAITKGIVEAHGGTIRAESELGSGTRIVFTLPKSGA
jgi:PAS domain S-box-containing protein